jgi:RNA chaperone Hfq
MNYNEDEFYKKFANNKIKVSVFLRNGIRLIGRIIGRDDVTITLQSSDTMLIYKSAIMSIVPEK